MNNAPSPSSVREGGESHPAVGQPNGPTAAQPVTALNLGLPVDAADPQEVSPFAGDTEVVDTSTSSQRHSGSSAPDQPRWAYSPEQGSVPLHQGPFFAASDEDASDTGDNFVDADPFRSSEQKDGSVSPHQSRRRDRPHTALFMEPNASSRLDDPTTTEYLPTSESQTPAFARQRDSTISATGSTAAARESAVAAGYSSPRTRAAPILASPSQEFNDYSGRRNMVPAQSDVEKEREPTALPEPATHPTERENPSLDATPKRGSSLGGLLKWVLLAAIVVVVLAIALGVGLGVGLNKHSDSHQQNVAKTRQSNVASPDTALPKGLEPLPPWNWTDPMKKAYGVNIGGQFILERWMYEDWMVKTGGPDAWDEYSMSRNLGPDKMRDALNNHMASWFVEDHMDQLQKAGINMIRMPIGYWPFMSAQEAGEPYVNASQLAYYSLAMNWAWKRKMYVLVDLHGMPGSQNGDQSSGHNMSYTKDVPWFEENYQNMSRTVVHNVLEWISKHPARSTVSGITTVNEPQTHGGNSTRMKILKDFYDFSIEAAGKYKIPVVLHHGFVPNQYERWEDYMEDQDPEMVIFDDHPYPAWFQQPNPTEEKVIVDKVCQLGHQGKDFPVPVVMAEWSGVNNVNRTDVTTRYLAVQANTYGWSAGSIFFNFRLNTTENNILGPPPNIAHTYSLLDMLPLGNPVGQFPIYDGKQPEKNFTDSLKPTCGKPPSYPWME